MNEPHFYQVDLTWATGRKGILHSNVLDTKIEVATPPEFSKGIAGIWTPEHLFVASVNSCFMTTFLAIAEKSRLDNFDFSSNAVGTLESKDGKLQITRITLHPIVTVEERDVTLALRVLQKAKNHCLITNSIKSDILFAPDVKAFSHLPSDLF